MHLNKYIILGISSYLKEKIFLNIIKYNKELMNKLSITKYTYQKKYFYSIITPSLITTLLTNKSFLLKYFDEETINKLKSDWENETTEIYESKNKIFNFNNKTNNITDTELEKTTILNINRENINIINEKNFTNLIELNLYKFAQIKIPISLLQNLEKLSIKKVNCLSLDYNKKEPIIFLNKLKYLYLDINSQLIEQDEDIKINLDNLEYLYIILRSCGGFLIPIFNFKFMSVVFGNKIESIKEELFKDKYIDKLKYFNLKIVNYTPPVATYAVGDFEHFDNSYGNYICSKTKDNKYLFKTKLTYSDNASYEHIDEEIRCSNDFNFNNYYYKERGLTLVGNNAEVKNIKDIFNYNTVIIQSKYFKVLHIHLGEDEEEEEEENGNKWKGTEKEEEDMEGEEDDDDDDEDDISLYEHEYIEEEFISNENLLKLYENINSNNNVVEIMSFDYLNIEIYPQFIDKVKFFVNLKNFYVNQECYMQNNQLKELLKNLINLNVCIIEIYYDNKEYFEFKKKMKLNKNQKKDIIKMFPNITIIKQKNKSCILNNN